MKKIVRTIIILITLIMTGCSSKSLVFTDRSSYGATIRIDPAQNEYFINVGGDLDSFAIVPMIDKNGDAIFVKRMPKNDPDKEYLEAASVFASFQAKTNAEEKSAGISFGRIFATGHAAVISAQEFSKATEKLAEQKKIESLSKLTEEQTKTLQEMTANEKAKLEILQKSSTE